MPTATFPNLLDRIEESAKNTDQQVSPDNNLRETLLEIVASGFTEYGLSDSSEPIAAQAEVIHSLATKCVSSAFVTWSHRMTIEYIDRWASDEIKSEFLKDLRAGNRVGSTALATALADKSGKEVLPITFEEVDGEFLITGVIPWASNLYHDTLIVFAARNEKTEERVIFTSVLSAKGTSVKPAGELLGLNATASGTVKFDGLRLPATNVLTRDVNLFLGQMRPRFLVLQSAFCLGLTKASLDSIATAPSAAPFASDIARFQAEYDRLTAESARLSETLVSYPAPGNGHSPLEFLKLRLGAAELAQAAARVELATIGGRGYYSASDTSRRIRESLFLSVQAPTEGSLRWEISQLAS
jgi:alkylation response protein AidB-like acyl-CoA dehydrogenase